MSIVITGNGHLGNYLYNELIKKNYAALSIYHYTDDIKKLDFGELYRLRTSVVINTAAKTNVSWCEQNPSECYRNNFTYPINIINEMSKLRWNTTFINFNTGAADCLDGLKNPKTAYGRSKKDLEHYFVDNEWVINNKVEVFYHKIHHLCSPMNIERNLITKLINAKWANTIPNTITDAKLVLEVIEDYLAGDAETDFNIYNPRAISPYTMCEIMCYMGLRKDLPEPIEEESSLITNARLYDYHFEDVFKPEDSTTALRKILEEYKKNV